MSPVSVLTISTGHLTVTPLHHSLTIWPCYHSQWTLHLAFICKQPDWDWDLISWFWRQLLLVPSQSYSDITCCGNQTHQSVSDPHKTSSWTKFGILWHESQIPLWSLRCWSDTQWVQIQHFTIIISMVWCVSSSVRWAVAVIRRWHHLDQLITPTSVHLSSSHQTLTKPVPYQHFSNTFLQSNLFDQCRPPTYNMT